MLTDAEILERNHRLMQAVHAEPELRIGGYEFRIEYLLYHREKDAFRTGIHLHHFWELSFLCHGAVDYHLTREDKSVPLAAGDNRYVLIPPFRKHCRENVLPEALILGFMLTVTGRTPEEERRFLKRAAELEFRPAGSARPEAAELQRHLAQEAEPLDAEITAGRIRLLLLAIFGENFGDLFAGAPQRQRRNPVWLAGHHIGENLICPLPADELARLCGLSRRHFYRCFEAEYGMPVNEFIRRRRLRQAARELRETQRPLKEIAADAGFRNLSYFTRQFRKLYSVPPGRFRQQYAE